MSRRTSRAGARSSSSQAAQDPGVAAPRGQHENGLATESLYWPCAARQFTALGAFTLLAAVTSALFHWGGTSLESVLAALAVCWSLPVAWFVAFHGRVRVTQDRVTARAPGAPLEKAFAVRRGDRVCIEPTPSYGTVVWSVALQTSRDAREVICGRTSYDEARRVAHAICRVTRCPLEGAPGRQGNKPMPASEIGLTHLERCRRIHDPAPECADVRPVGLAITSTPEGGTVYSWGLLPWHVVLGLVTGPAACSYLAGLLGIAAAMLYEGVSGRAVLMTALVVHALLAVLLAAVVASSARLVVSRRRISHRILVAGLPLSRQHVVTDRIEEMGILDGRVVISDDRSSLLFRMGHDPEMSQGNARWLLGQVEKSVRAAQEEAGIRRG